MKQIFNQSTFIIECNNFRYTFNKADKRIWISTIDENTYPDFFKSNKSVLKLPKEHQYYALLAQGYNTLTSKEIQSYYEKMYKKATTAL